MPTVKNKIPVKHRPAGAFKTPASTTPPAKSQVSVPPECRLALGRIKQRHGVNHGVAVTRGVTLLEAVLEKSKGEVLSNTF